MKVKIFVSALLISFAYVTNCAIAQSSINKEEIIQKLNAQMASVNANNFSAQPGDEQELKLKWNTNTSAWDSSSLKIKTNGPNGPLSEMGYQYQSSKWNVNEKITYFYNSNIMDSSHFYAWNGQDWALTIRYFYTYTTFNALKELHLLYFSGGTWLAFMDLYYYYDVNEKKTGAKSLSMFGVPDSVSFTTDVNGNVLTETSFKFKNNLWKKSELNTSTYNVDNKKTQEISQRWDTVTSAYVNSSKENWTYNGSAKEIYYINQNWDGTSFKDNSKRDTYYDGNGNLTYNVTQKYQTTWVNDSKTVFNANVSIITSIPEIISFETTSLYPNPGSGKYFLHSQLTNGEISVYNMLGEKVYHSKEINPIVNEIDLSKQPDGIFLITIHSGMEKQSGKILKQ